MLWLHMANVDQLRLRERQKQEWKLEGGFVVTVLPHSVKLRLAQRTVLPSEQTLLFRQKPQAQTICANDSKSIIFTRKGRRTWEKANVGVAWLMQTGSVSERHEVCHLRASHTLLRSDSSEAWARWSSWLGTKFVRFRWHLIPAAKWRNSRRRCL